MKNKKQSNENMQFMPIYMSIGLSVGVAIGAAIKNIPVCMCIGMGIGVAIGAALDAVNRKKTEEKSDADEEETK